MSSSSISDSLSDENSSIPSGMICFMFRPNSYILMALFFTKLTLILPLSVIILYHGLQEWRQKDSSSSSAAATGHINLFTYHLIFMELLTAVGPFLFCCGIIMDNVDLVIIGIYVTEFSWNGEMFFHALTCVEQYLAVVHPFIYLRLRNERGIRIRNVSTACVWLLCFTEIALMVLPSLYMTLILDCCILILTLSVITFCSLSVLCALIRPVPGDRRENREMDKSKKNAFCVILIILSLLLLRFVWDLTLIVLNVSGNQENCTIMICGFLVHLPNSLVLPLLFLQRMCSKTN